MWGWVGVGAEYSKGWRAVVGQTAALVAGITALVFGFLFFFLSWCELSAVNRSWGQRAEYVLLDKGISASYWT